MNTPMTGIRASDAEREQVAKLLQAATGEGRLTPEEAGERLAQASAARFRHELEQLVADLPPVITRAVPRERVPRAFWVIAGLLRATAVVAFLLLFWRFALWPVAFFGIVGLFAFARALRYGWYARRQWWMMRHGVSRRWAAVVR